MLNRECHKSSVLGPSIFLYYINDIPVGLNYAMRLFAVDIIEYMAIKYIIDAQHLQEDLDKLAI